MLTLVTIVIFIIVGFTIKGRSRTFDLALIAFLSVVSALNTTHADYLNYLVLYRSSYLSFGSNDGEIGWQALCYIGNMLGLSYQVFFGVLLFVVLCAAYVLMRKISGNTAFSWSLLLLFPLFADIVQIRQLVAAVVLMYGFWLSSRNPGIKGGACGLGTVLIAFCFHSSALAFAMVYALLWVSGKGTKPMVLSSLLIALVCVVFSNQLFALLADEFESKFDMSYVSSANILVVAANIVEFCLVEGACYCYSKKKASSVDQRFVKHVRAMNWMLLAMLPLIALSGGRLTRFQYYRYPTNYLVLSKLVFEDEMKMRSRYWMEGAVITLYIVYVVGRSILFNLQDWQAVTQSFLVF